MDGTMIAAMGAAVLSHTHQSAPGFGGESLWVAAVGTAVTVAVVFVAAAILAKRGRR